MPKRGRFCRYKRMNLRYLFRWQADLKRSPVNLLFFERGSWQLEIAYASPLGRELEDVVTFAEVSAGSLLKSNSVSNLISDWISIEFIDYL